MIEDNLYAPAVHPTGVELARAAMYTRNVQAFDFFNDITKTIYTAGGTDFGLGSTAHSTIDGINWSNKFAAKVDLSIENLELALQNWFNQMVDQRSRKWDVTPRFLMVAPGDMMRAERLLASTQLPEGGDNDPNVVRQRNLQLIVNPHMTTVGSSSPHQERRDCGSTPDSIRPSSVTRMWTRATCSSRSVTGTVTPSFILPESTAPRRNSYGGP